MVAEISTFASPAGTFAVNLPSVITVSTAGDLPSVGTNRMIPFFSGWLSRSTSPLTVPSPDEPEHPPRVATARSGTVRAHTRTHRLMIPPN